MADSVLFVSQLAPLYNLCPPCNALPQPLSPFPVRVRGAGGCLQKGLRIPNRGAIRPPRAEKGEAHKPFAPPEMSPETLKGAGGGPAAQGTAFSTKSTRRTELNNRKVEKSAAGRPPASAEMDPPQGNGQGLGASHLYTGFSAAGSAAASISRPTVIVRLPDCRKTAGEPQV